MQGTLEIAAAEVLVALEAGDEVMDEDRSSMVCT